DPRPGPPGVEVRKRPFFLRRSLKRTSAHVDSPSMNRARRARAPGPARGESGFTMIELVMATGVMLVAIVAMLWTTLAGFRGIAEARRRQTANGLANQALEQIRALAFDTVKKGLDNTDLSTTIDTAITKTGSGSAAT